MVKCYLLASHAKRTTVTEKDAATLRKLEDCKPESAIVCTDAPSRGLKRKAVDIE